LEPRGDNTSGFISDTYNSYKVNCNNIGAEIVQLADVRISSRKPK
jgi:hypothetical protein